MVTEKRSSLIFFFFDIFLETQYNLNFIIYFILKILKRNLKYKTFKGLNLYFIFLYFLLFLIYIYIFMQNISRPKIQMKS